MRRQKRTKSLFRPTIAKLIQSSRNVFPWAATPAMQTHSIKRMTVKVLVLGGAKVGKTSLIKAICNKQGSELPENYQPTVHEVFEKEVLVGNVLVKFEFIDTAGQYSFPAMRHHYINQSHIYLLVFSKDNPGSYVEIDRLRKEIESIKGKHSTELSVLVAETKVDTFHNENYASSSSNPILNWCYSCIKCSVKTGYNIHSIVEYFLKESALLCKNMEELSHEDHKEVSGRYLYDHGGSRCIQETDPHKEHFRKMSIRKWSVRSSP